MAGQKGRTASNQPFNVTTSFVILLSLKIAYMLTQLTYLLRSHLTSRKKNSFLLMPDFDCKNVNTSGGIPIVECLIYMLRALGLIPQCHKKTEQI